MEASANKEKLKATIAYIAAKVRPGKAALFKLLYIADFTAYERLGRSITDETYENFRLGPVPKSLSLAAGFRSLTCQCVDVVTVPTGWSNDKEEMRPKHGVDFAGILDPEDIAVLDDVLREHGNKTGPELIALTHRELPYLLTSRGEDIPYYLAPYRNFVRPTEDEVDALFEDPDFNTQLTAALGRIPLEEEEA